MIHAAGAILCVLIAVACLVLGLRQKRTEWLMLSVLVALVGGIIVLFLFVLNK